MLGLGDLLSAPLGICESESLLSLVCAGRDTDNELTGDKEDMGGDALLSSAVPQDLMGQPEVQGCDSGREVTAVSGADRPTAGTWLERACEVTLLVK